MDVLDPDLEVTAAWEACRALGTPEDHPPDATISRPRPAEERATDGHTAHIASLPSLGLDAQPPDLELGETLGQGGMGKVELARQRSLRREVAVKTLHARPEPRAAEALLQEALATGALEHPNIVPVHQLGRDPAGRPALVMKRVQGTSWRDLIRDPAHPGWSAWSGGDRLERHIQVLLAVANALQFAHSRGVIHRDVKPANVMVGAFGEVYLLDWGLGLRLDQRDPAKDALVGTPGYMAPEMLDGEARVDERTDVYLLGATLHEVLTGEPRHRGRSAMTTLLAAHRSVPHVYPPDVPRELADLCNQATARDPGARPQSVLAFRRALEDHLRHAAAARLALEADRRLTELRRIVGDPATAPARRVEVETECRFGYRQALREWPENARARDGLQACLELLIEHELARRNAGSVESLLSELPRPRPDLEARLAALRADQEAGTRDQAKLRALEIDLDPTIAGRPRAIVILMSGLFAAAGGVIASSLARSEWIQLNHATGLGFFVAMLLVATAGVLRFRRALFENAVNRRLIGVGYVLLSVPLLSHLLALLGGLDVPTTQILIAASAATTLLAVAPLMGDWRFLPGALAFTAAACATAFVHGRWPAWTIDAISIGSGLALATSAAISWRAGRDR